MWSHKQLVTLCTVPCKSPAFVIELLLCLWLGCGEMDLCGQVMSCHAMPVFHGMGVLQIALVVSATSSGYFLFQQFSAVYWSGNGSLQAGLPSRSAKPSERIGGYDDN